MRATRITNSLLIAMAVVVIFIYGKNLIIPFVIALFFWFLIKEIRDLVNKVPFIKNKIPNMVLNLFGTLLIFAILGGVVQILAVNIKQLSSSLPEYQKNMQDIAAYFNTTFNIDLVARAKEFLGDYEYTSFLKGLFNSLTDLFGKAFLIIIYTLFLLLEEPFFSSKIHAIYSKQENFEEVDVILKQIDKSIGRYISIKTLVSLSTGILSYIALLFIGIDAPLFWAFLIFLMNYIPTIGSLIATIFPAVFAMLQFGEVMPGVWTLIIVGAIQLIMGNYIDPKLTGDSLNVSPLVVILGLAFWGATWGIIGMILSVPISVMIITIFSKIPATRSIAIILSKRGNV
ncbi:MAG: AI-2E family transporter [Salinivirgaceae bacterium]|nr:AI-2E family transporter [Salinivirgaceae bacterium]